MWFALDGALFGLVYNILIAVCKPGPYTIYPFPFVFENHQLLTASSKTSWDWNYPKTYLSGPHIPPFFVVLLFLLGPLFFWPPTLFLLTPPSFFPRVLLRTNRPLKHRVKHTHTRKKAHEIHKQKTTTHWKKPYPKKKPWKIHPKKPPPTQRIHRLLTLVHVPSRWVNHHNGQDPWVCNWSYLADEGQIITTKTAE